MKKALTGNFWVDRTEKDTEGKGVLVNSVRMLVILLISVMLSEVMYSLGFGNQNMIMIHLLAVLVISFVTPGYSYGILAALLNTAAYDFLITEPRMGFSFSFGLPVTLFIMLLVTIVTSTMTSRIKERAQIFLEREKHAQQLYEINQKLLAARSLKALTELTSDYVSEHLRRPVILYTRDPSQPDSGYCDAPEGTSEQAMVFYAPEQKKRVHRMFRLGESETERPFDDSSYDVFNVPVVSQRYVLGVIGIACKDNPISQKDLIFVRMLVGQMALALELQYLSDTQSHIVVEAEKEKTRGTLLRSISHDLRTPLTSILGASSTILEQSNLDAATLESLVKGIKLDAQWLIRMVENILIITRISGDNLNVKKNPEAAEEVISEAVSIVRKRFPDYIIHVHIPDELLIVPMDATLISQVLINLLENAVKNSPDGSLILVDLKEQDGFAEFDISDNGSGIPQHLLDSLFEIHSPTKEQAIDISRGMGIGLSICKTIVQAHGGYIEGNNRVKQGAKFSFRLPMRETAKTDE